MGLPEPGPFADFVDPVDGTRWSVDVEFLGSAWRCRWGDGCLGILDEPAADLGQGCCSVGAHLLDDEEAMLIGAIGSALDPSRFQNHAAAAADAPNNPDGGKATRVVDDACIFHNRPGFSGGVGCALYLAALDEGESTMDWRPTICWQDPIRVDTSSDGTKTLRRWRREDWGGKADELAWCCTEAAHADGLPSAYIGEVAVAVSLRNELSGIVGPEIAQALEDRVEGHEKN